MTQTNKQTWNDGQLRSVQLITNGFPEKTDEPALPDELFLENNQGERLVEIIRTSVTRHSGSVTAWDVRYGPEKNSRTKHNDFESAFQHAITRARMEIEDQ